MVGERGKDTALEVSWCRQLLELADREYCSMVDGLLAEHKQLEELLSLLAQQLDNLSSDFPGKALEGPEALQAAVNARDLILSRLDELLRLRGDELRSARDAQASLQQRLREEEMEKRSLQRYLESNLEAASKVLPAVDVSTAESEGGTNALIARLRRAEETRAQETRRREVTEVRCALIEKRCQDAVSRLEAELVDLRAKVEHLTPPSLGALCGSRGFADESFVSSPAKTITVSPAESRRLTPSPKLDQLQQRHRDMYERYMADPTPDTEAGQTLSTLPQLPGSGRKPLTACSSADCPSSSSEEDYAWEGYMEQSQGTEGFEKVFVEIRDAHFVVRSDRGDSPEVLNKCPLASLAGPAVLNEDSTRCLEVRFGAGPAARFRCVSERRAEQWVEAINQARSHANTKIRRPTS